MITLYCLLINDSCSESETQKLIYRHTATIRQKDIVQKKYCRNTHLIARINYPARSIDPGVLQYRPVHRLHGFRWESG